MISEKQLFQLCKEDPICLHSSHVAKRLYKFWTGLVKLLRFYIEKGQSVTYLGLGTFRVLPLSFTPSHIFLNNFKYSNSTYGTNSGISISNSNLSAICEMDTKKIQECCQEILAQSSRQIFLGKIIKLDLKFGILLLYKSKFEFKSYKAEYPLEYHASNPNPINYDNTINSDSNGCFKKNSKLPPLAVHSKPSLIISSRYSKKVGIDPYLSAKELSLIHKSRFQNKFRMRDLPEAVSVDKIHLKDEGRLQSRMESYRDFVKVNKSLVEHRKTIRDEAKVMKNSEVYDYFPFTSGEALEATRKKHQEHKKKDLQVYLEAMKNRSFIKNSKVDQKRLENESLSSKDRSLNLSLAHNQKHLI